MEKTGKQVIGAGYHRPVCAKCHCEMRPETNGVGVLDMVERGREQEKDATFVHIEPYELWDADLWKCPKCGIEVIGGFASGPISAHYEPDFQKMTKYYEDKGLLIKNTG